MRSTFVLVIALVMFGRAGAVQTQLLQFGGGSQLRSIPGSQVWGKALRQDLMFPSHYRSRIRPTCLLVGLDHPSGMRFLALFPRHGVFLPLRWTKRFFSFDEWGGLKPGYFVQAAEHDFNHDGVPELVIAAGNRRMNLAVCVVQYHAPRFARQASRAANWSLAGFSWGQTGVVIRKDALNILPGSHTRR